MRGCRRTRRCRIAGCPRLELLAVAHGAGRADHLWLAVGRRVVRAAHRLRQSRQPRARANRWSVARVRDAHRARRGRPAPDASDRVGDWHPRAHRGSAEPGDRRLERRAVGESDGLTLSGVELRVEWQHARVLQRPCVSRSRCCPRSRPSSGSSSSAEAASSTCVHAAPRRAPRGKRLGTILVVCQVALAIVLISGAGILVRSLLHHRSRRERRRQSAAHPGGRAASPLGHVSESRIAAAVFRSAAGGVREHSGSRDDVVLELAARGCRQLARARDRRPAARVRRAGAHPPVPDREPRILPRHRHLRALGPHVQRWRSRADRCPWRS